MPVLQAHVAGVPVEESVLALLPVAGVLLAGARLWLNRLRRLIMGRSPLPPTVHGADRHGI